MASERKRKVIVVEDEPEEGEIIEVSDGDEEQKEESHVKKPPTKIQKFVESEAEEGSDEEEEDEEMDGPTIYCISKEELIHLSGSWEAIYADLTGHLVMGHGHIEFPDEFYVICDEGTDDTDGIRFYRDKECKTKPFLTMGSSDTGFTLAYALFRKLGRC